MRTCCQRLGQGAADGHLAGGVDAVVGAADATAQADVFPLELAVDAVFGGVRVGLGLALVQSIGQGLLAHGHAQQHTLADAPVGTGHQALLLHARTRAQAIGVQAQRAATACHPHAGVAGEDAAHRGAVQALVDAIAQEVILQQCGACGGVDLTAQAVEGRHDLRHFQAYDGVVHRMARAQRFHRAGHGLLVGVDDHVGEGQFDIRHGYVIARHGQIDVVGVIAQARIEESEVAAHPGERARHTITCRQHGVAGGDRPVAGCRNGHGTRSAQSGLSGHRDEVTAAIGGNVHLVGGARVEHQVAAHRQTTDAAKLAAARRQHAAAEQVRAAHAARAGQQGVVGHLDVAAQRTGHLQHAAVDHGGTGKRAAVPGQGQEMTPLLQLTVATEPARVADHAGGIGLEAPGAADLDVAARHGIADRAHGAAVDLGQAAEGAIAQHQLTAVVLFQHGTGDTAQPATEGHAGAVGNPHGRSAQQAHAVVQGGHVDQAQRGAITQRHHAAAGRGRAVQRQRARVDLQAAAEGVCAAEHQHARATLAQPAGAADVALDAQVAHGIQLRRHAHQHVAVDVHPAIAAQHATRQFNAADAVAGADALVACAVADRQRRVVADQQ
ncbi:hypothetical protein D3C71_1067670 [compost metagenome]